MSQSFNDIKADYPEEIQNAFIAYANIQGINLNDDKEWKKEFIAWCKQANYRVLKERRSDSC
jgi:hypothetical protein